ncbi:MAG: fatty acid desaturase CarF family protein [Crocosphaera sp.]
MSILKLPQKSIVFLTGCGVIYILALHELFKLSHVTIYLLIAAFFIGGFITDLLTGVAHFCFDYIWPDETPILGPIAVDFRAHHFMPTLDPSAIDVNFTMGAYAGLPFTLTTMGLANLQADSYVHTLITTTFFSISLWMLGFHQIHSYAHMGSSLLADEFNEAVQEISQLPDNKQKAEFQKLFDGKGIPPLVRFLQKVGLFLRPEIHWKHHINFETDFSSLNGWSDPLMNLIYQPLAHRRKLSSF